MQPVSRRSFVTGTAGALLAGACATSARVRTSASTEAFDKERFVDDVKQARPEGQAAVAEVIARAVSDPGSVLRALGEPTSASVQVLHRDETLSIFNIVWPPLTVLVPHDHLMWASIGVYTGREDNILWESSGETIEATRAASVAAREVFSLPPDGIHSVTNPVEAYTAALHVYGGDLTAVPRSQWNALSLAREPFDLEDARRVLREADERFGARASRA